jgi:hypothetical protein
MTNGHILSILVGIALLVLGRRLFWLFVGAAGFIFGMHVAQQFLHGRPEWMTLLLAIAAGLIGALFAIFLQKIAICVAGFFLGGYVLTKMAAEFGWSAGQYHWIVFLVGGIAGLLLISGLFDWALIILSSISGAILLLQPLPPAVAMKRPLFIVLAAAGIIIQAALMRGWPQHYRRL